MIQYRKVWVTLIFTTLTLIYIQNTYQWLVKPELFVYLLSLLAIKGTFDLLGIVRGSNSVDTKLASRP
jgi:hypothetical protein